MSVATHVSSHTLKEMDDWMKEQIAAGEVIYCRTCDLFVVGSTAHAEHEGHTIYTDVKFGVSTPDDVSCDRKLAPTGNLDDCDLPLGDELCRSCPWWGKGWGPKEDYSANLCRLVASGHATSMRQAEDSCPEMPVRKVRTLEASIGMEMYLRRNAEANYAHALSEVLKLKTERKAGSS